MASIILFILTTLLCVAAVSLVLPNERIINNISISFVLLACFWCALLGLFGFLGIGYSTNALTFINVLLLLFITLYCRVTNLSPTKQSYRIEPTDIIAFIVAICVAAYCGVRQFTPDLLINYETTDPANHFGASMSLFSGEIARGQYFSYLISAAIISIASAIFPPNELYHAYVFSEIFMLAIAGLTFYSTAVRFTEKKKPVPPVLLLFFYMLGYPLNNMIFGFSYLGTAVSLISVIIFCMTIYISNIDSERKVLFASLVSLSLFGLISSYSLFVPAIYFAVFLAIAFLLQKRKLPIKRIILEEITVFSFPVIIGFLVVYVSLFGSSSGSSVGGAIAIEGYIYRDLFSSFIPIAPFALLGAHSSVRDGGDEALTLLIISIVFLLFTAALFIIGVMGFASSYYYYKTYYVLWLLAFLLAAQGISTGLKQCATLITCIAVVYCSLFVFAFSGLDAKLSQKRPLYNPEPTAYRLFQIYNFNFSRFDRVTLDGNNIQFFFDAASISKNSSNTVILADDTTTYWYKALTDFEENKFWWHKTQSEVLESVASADYVIVVPSDTLLTTSDGCSFSTLLDNSTSALDVVIESDSGVVYRTK